MAGPSYSCMSRVEERWEQAMTDVLLGQKTQESHWKIYTRFVNTNSGFEKTEAPGMKHFKQNRCRRLYFLDFSDVWCSQKVI